MGFATSHCGCHCMITIKYKYIYIYMIPGHAFQLPIYIYIYIHIYIHNLSNVSMISNFKFDSFFYYYHTSLHAYIYAKYFKARQWTQIGENICGWYYTANITSNSNLDIAQQLSHEMFTKLYHWCVANTLSINNDKPNFILLNMKNKPVPKHFTSIQTYAMEINIVNFVQYRGMLLDACF